MASGGRFSSVEELGEGPAVWGCGGGEIGEGGFVSVAAGGGEPAFVEEVAAHGTSGK